ncbi:hypothetical protein CFY92_0015775 [Leptospira interrogans]|nr:hypothetical protein [Leptospira interrogans]EMN54186.1 hypothetical protein LEP1GSC089_4052 [Leptospira interrogans serovar Autumnalis str. LP101]WOT10476.1 hypothetical protein CFY92_0015775 [Leptospira interrogans]
MKTSSKILKMPSALIEEWRIFYNSEKPPSSLGGLTYLKHSA